MLKINKILYLYIAFLLLIVFRIIPNIIFIQSVILILFAVCILMFINKNKTLWGLGVFSLGSIMNSIVMMFNNNKMPVSRELLHKLNDIDFFKYLETSKKHVMMDESTQLSFLADTIYVPGSSGKWLRIVSIGDIFIFIGVLVILISIIMTIVNTKHKTSVMQN